ncbi:hypothetical protein RI367_002250 [Sorochytrium milnesiophthora]
MSDSTPASVPSVPTTPAAASAPAAAPASASGQRMPSNLTPEEQKIFKLYGKLPQKKTMLDKHKDRKYFDSGDYAMSKVGKTPPTSVGSGHPVPSNIPHAHPVSSPSLTKESGLANEMASTASTEMKKD